MAHTEAKNKLEGEGIALGEVIRTEGGELCVRLFVPTQPVCLVSLSAGAEMPKVGERVLVILSEQGQKVELLSVIEPSREVLTQDATEKDSEKITAVSSEQKIEKKEPEQWTQVFLPNGLRLLVGEELSRLALCDEGGVLFWVERRGAELRLESVRDLSLVSREGDLRLQAPKGSVRIESKEALTLESTEGEVQIHAQQHLIASSGRMVVLHAASHATVQSLQGNVNLVAEQEMRVEARRKDTIVRGRKIKLN